MSETPTDAVTLVKQSLTLSTVVARYAAVTKRSGRHVACCPFHLEKTPSFNIDDRKGVFHCFGCGKGGDLIHFVQEIEQMDFNESLAFLAELAGVELPKRRGSGPNRKKVDALRAINEQAAAFYQAGIRKEPAAIAYLAQRSVTDSVRDLFRLGYASQAWDDLYHHLRDQFDDELLKQSGLIREGRGGKYYDFFRHRIIFPICDAYGHIVAFGGRRVADEGPKYINSPETPIYTKGRHVYNLQFAKPFLRREPVVVVVEGYLDAIQVYQGGIGAVVASLGTAFTPDQARLLKRYAKTIVLNFDGDAAGFKAARSSIETLLQSQLEIKVVVLPDGQDPDDFVRLRGVDAYRQTLKDGMDFYTFLLNHLASDLDDPHQKSLVVQELCQTIAKIPDPVVQEHYVERLAHDLGIKISAILRVMQNIESPQKPESQRVRTRLMMSHTEKYLLSLALKNADLFDALPNRDEVMRVLEILFTDRSWAMEFIEATQDPGDEDPFQCVPDSQSSELRGLLFSEEFEGDSGKLVELLPDLIRAMIQKRRKANNQALRRLGAAETEQKRELIKQNFELDRYLHQLNR